MIEALVAALGVFLRLVDAAVDHLKVSHDEFGIDNVNVAQRVGRTLDVCDICVVKAAHNVDNRVAAADVGQELVAQTFALRCALHETCNVDKLNDGRGELLRVMLVAQPLEPLVRHGHDADIRVNGAERIVVCCNASICDCIEKRRLSYIGKSDDP